MNRFERLSHLLSFRSSRRSIVQSGSAAAAGSAAFAAFGAYTHAQDVPPSASPAASPAPTDTDKAMFLFVQSASSATFEPSAAGGSAYVLTLQGHTGGTVYFSDRPERIFGEAPTQKFLDGLGFTSQNPPNAAIVTTKEDGTGDVLVVELTEPQYDDMSGTLTYGASVLENYSGDGLKFAASMQQDLTLEPLLGATSLFIDDCSDQVINCYTTCNDQVGTLGSHGMCWSWEDLGCEPCGGGYNGTDTTCNDTFAACKDNCFSNYDDACNY